jgi:hypothetical protein
MSDFRIVKYVFHVTWDMVSTWDGDDLYDTEKAAKAGAELDYEQYQSDNEEPVGVLTWISIGKDVRHLQENGEGTGVYINMRSVYSLKNSKEAIVSVR